MYKIFFNQKKIILLFLLFSATLFAKSYYVSTTGDDNNPGTIDSPFKTINKLLYVIAAGDSGIIRGGTYPLNYTTQHSGTESAPIVITNYPGEHPVFVGTGRVSDGGRFRVRNNWYIIENLEVKNGSAGFTFTHDASHNILRNCSVHYHYYTGIYLADGASYNQIINCDTYDMYDSGTDGGNGDGVSVSGQSSTPGPGNIFIGCRSWHNSDDGFDVWKAGYPVEFVNCYSFRNGTHSGDGNGFKLGINKTSRDKHVLKNCIAWKNRQNGFDYNENTQPQTLYNCTAYDNYRNYKFGDLRGGPETDHIWNCISARAGTSDYLLTSIRQNNMNSWNLKGVNAPGIVKDNFISVNDSVIAGPRNPDGSIPESNFLHLKEGSIFVDAGVDVGLAYQGKAPDFGAFESPFTVGVDDNEVVQNIRPKEDKFELTSYPSPATSHAVINYVLPAGDYTAELTVYNILGQKVKSLQLNASMGHITFSTNNLSSGTYIYVVKTPTHISDVKKILVVK